MGKLIGGTYFYKAVDYPLKSDARDYTRKLRKSNTNKGGLSIRDKY